MTDGLIASDVSTIAGLNAAIESADGEGGANAPNEISLAGGASIELTQALEAFKLKNGTFENPAIQSAKALRGASASGGGAGLSGRLLVAGAANAMGGRAPGDPRQAVAPVVKRMNVSFHDD